MYLLKNQLNSYMFMMFLVYFYRISLCFEVRNTFIEIIYFDTELKLPRNLIASLLLTVSI